MASIRAVLMVQTVWNGLETRPLEMKMRSRQLPLDRSTSTLHKFGLYLMNSLFLFLPFLPSSPFLFLLLQQVNNASRKTKSRPVGPTKRKSIALSLALS